MLTESRTQFVLLLPIRAHRHGRPSPTRHLVALLHPSQLSSSTTNSVTDACNMQRSTAALRGGATLQLGGTITVYTPNIQTPWPPVRHDRRQPSEPAAGSKRQLIWTNCVEIDGAVLSLGKRRCECGLTACDIMVRPRLHTARLILHALIANTRGHACQWVYRKQQVPCDQPDT